MKYSTAIVVVTKCPRIGTSKSRLNTLLGDEGSCKLAEALLSDTIVSLSKDPHLSSVLKVLLYAPGDESGQQQLICLLHNLGLDVLDQAPFPSNLSTYWYLMPITENTSIFSLTQSDLGQVLVNGLIRVRVILNDMMSSFEESSIGSVLFLGMDSPELRLGEIEYALNLCSEDNRRAYMCPAEDGGYGLLCLPNDAPATIFDCGIRWSSSLTAISQAKALSDHKIDVTFGTMMRDIDVPEDVYKLVTRLCGTKNENIHERDVLTEFHPPSTIDVTVLLMSPCHCPFTYSVLVELGLIQIGFPTESELPCRE